MVALETPNTLFDEKLATFMKDDTFNQNASPGFIEIYSLQMRMSQDAEKFALFTVGPDKARWMPLAKEMVEMGYTLYSTEGTHKAFKEAGISSILLHKMHEKRNPNLEDLLSQDRFDIIFHEESESISNKEDTEVIREWAVKTDTKLIKEFETAEKFVHKLSKQTGRRVKMNGKGE